MGIQTDYEGANKLTNKKMLAPRQNISQWHMLSKIQKTASMCKSRISK